MLGLFKKSSANVSSQLLQPSKQVESRPSKEVSEVMDLLIKGKIPTEYQEGVKLKLRPILEEPGHVPYAELLARSNHPCILEYLPQVLQLLEKQKASAIEEMKKGMKPDELQDFKVFTSLQAENYYKSIAELLGRGFTDALKMNIVFDEYGNPKGMREADQTRFPKCHAALSGAGRKKTIKKKIQKKRKTLRRSKMGRKMH